MFEMDQRGKIGAIWRRTSLFDTRKICPESDNMGDQLRVLNSRLSPMRRSFEYIGRSKNLDTRFDFRDASAGNTV